MEAPRWTDMGRNPSPRNGIGWLPAFVADDSFGRSGPFHQYSAKSALLDDQVYVFFALLETEAQSGPIRLASVAVSRG